MSRLPHLRWRAPSWWPGRPALDLADVQGNVVRGYTNRHAAYLLVDVGSVASGRRLLDELVPRVTIGAAWSSKPDSTLNVAVTAAGLDALGVAPARRHELDAAFREGMRARSHLLGDVGASAPEHWEAGLDGRRGHLLLTLTGTSAEALQRSVDRLLTRLDADTDVELVHHQQADMLVGAREHFGFLDGFSQPAVEGSFDGPPVDGIAGRRGWQSIPTGELLLGHRDADGVLPAAPAGPLGRNGTYAVYRKLHQDVAGFRALVAAHATDYPGGADALAAKIIGRWPDGTPLALSPDGPDPAISGDRTKLNDFRYGDDPLGLRCPVGAHVRRANPRDGEGTGAVMTTRHRIVRRGLPYGPPLPPGAPDDGVDRGLIFVCFSVDLGRQFEFVQRQWLNDGDQLGLGPDPDPILGSATHLPTGMPAKMVVGGDPPFLVRLGAPLVVTRGGHYLFVPGMAALRALAAGTA